ncbi:Hypothetical protein ORPV_338 [Orpheovirus IHUMI-LCC2]|uniref:Uncharacterized protein n=1 Tax=Orpheovirus IHUMI-LCC2 TaxID=2023057 RepID=A0A2I2L3W6_9VIRU|nr:Hypothetical protein ORPV_338 [Orpheovirus IHUMI-LCC2]SNW62242.1 Hypothetical protein ORPV_338 [Orpheovirus IHUMI-LCC2]
MGTRGLFGFVYKGKYYVAYNHYDSYPDYLGQLILDEIKAMLKCGSFDEWLEMAKRIKVVGNVNPTAEDINLLKEYTDLSVSRQSTDDWYCLLRKCQGSLKNVLESGYILNHVEEDGSPCFEEYAYLLNFDNKTFDFYEGSVLVGQYQFNNLPSFS